MKPEPKPEPVVTKTDDGKLILGSEEWLWISQAQQHIRAKVDDGKSLSSIGVSNVQPLSAMVKIGSNSMREAKRLNYLLSAGLSQNRAIHVKRLLSLGRSWVN